MSRAKLNIRRHGTISRRVSDLEESDETLGPLEFTTNFRRATEMGVIKAPIAMDASSGVDSDNFMPQLPQVDKSCVTEDLARSQNPCWFQTSWLIHWSGVIIFYLVWHLLQRYFGPWALQCSSHWFLISYCWFVMETLQKLIGVLVKPWETVNPPPTHMSLGGVSPGVMFNLNLNVSRVFSSSLSIVDVNIWWFGLNLCQGNFTTHASYCFWKETRCRW